MNFQKYSSGRGSGIGKIKVNARCSEQRKWKVDQAQVLAKTFIRFTIFYMLISIPAHDSKGLEDKIQEMSEDSDDGGMRIFHKQWSCPI